MSIIGRIRRVTAGRIEAFLASVEDPDVVFPQLLREMEEQIRAASDAEARAMASVKAAERSRDETVAQQQRLASGAESALRHDDEALAREAIETEVRCEAELARREAALETARAVCEEAHAARTQLQSQLEDLRAKKDEVLTRSRVLRSQQAVQRTVQGPTVTAGSILDAVARLETRVEEQEASLAVRKDLAAVQGGGPSDLEQRLEKLHADDVVERRLSALKEKIKG